MADLKRNYKHPFSLITLTRSELRTVEVLGRLHCKDKPWEALGEELGFNQGYLNLVANGKRRASDNLMRKLGIRKVRKPAPKRRVWERCSMDVLKIIWGERPTK